MKDKLSQLKVKYQQNPGWYWLLATVFFFPLLPEYISPFILFAGFIVFKRQWTREGKKAKVGTIGKLMMVYMGYAIISSLWSKTMFSTFATASLWWGMFLVEVMIFNLARTRQKIDKIFSTMAISGALNGLIASIQICTFTLFKYGYIEKSKVLVTPFYKFFDKKVYEFLPFQIDTTLWWDSRASGFFANPNLLATYMMIVYPISIYLYLNAKNKKSRIFYFIVNVLISAGVSATLTRAGCLLIVAGWALMFIILVKQHWKKMLNILVTTVALVVPSILTRYGVIFKVRGTGGVEAVKSTENHFLIWKSLIDYICTHAKALIIGIGFGLEQTGMVLQQEYNLTKPHAHNWLIENWVELGLIGTIMFIVVIIFAFGKLLEINANNGKKFTLVFCLFTAMWMYLLFGLTDYIFNSPKQIVLLFIILGLTQAISACYDKTLISDTKSLGRATIKEIKNTIHQKPIKHKKNK